MEENGRCHSVAYTKQGLLDVINGLPLAISVIDKNRKVILANQATGLFVNENESRLIGRVGGDAFGCIHHEDVPRGCGFGDDCLRCRLREAVLNTLEKKGPRQMVETTMVFKFQGEKNLRIHTQPLVLGGEDVVLLSIEDITEAKKHEQAEIQKEKLSAAIQTAGAVCHEMNQPLMVITGFADLLLDELSENEILKSNIRNIREQAMRLGEISRKLMGITQYKTKDYLSSSILDIDSASNDGDMKNDEIKER